MIDRPKDFERLFAFIQQYQPQMLDLQKEEIEEFINGRLSSALAEYNTIFEQTNSYQSADEAYEIALHQGLIFSPVEFIKQLFFHQFHKEIHTEQALDLYHKSKAYFDTFDLTDQFEGTDQEIELKNSLITFLK